MTDDLLARAKAALDATNCTDEMQDFFRVGLVPELLAEVERQRAEHDPAHCYHCTRCADADDSQREGYKRSQAEIERLRGALDRLKVEWLENYEYEGGDGGGPTGYVFKACADGLRAVLRGDQ